MSGSSSHHTKSDSSCGAGQSNGHCHGGSLSSPMIGSHAIDFEAGFVSTSGSVEKMSLRHEIESGEFVVLFFYPMAFTFVCPTELVDLSDNIHKFTELKCRVWAISCDSVHSLMAWRDRDYSSGGIGDLRIPLVSDMSRKISKCYGVYTCAGFPIRATFVIDRSSKIRYVEMIDASIGRDVDHLINKIAALKYSAETGSVCPAGWKRGFSGMQPDLSGVADHLMSSSWKNNS